MSRATIVAIAMGAILALLLRLRGSVPAVPATGGWLDIDQAELQR